MISEHLDSWLGLPVHPLGFAELKEDIPDLAKVVCRLYLDWEPESPLTELFARFLELEGVERAPGIIIGAFAAGDPAAESAEAVQLLVNARSRLPALRGIFLGDIIGEEFEISWIKQSDVSPLFAAYPNLEHFAVRGGDGLVLGRVEHASLKSLAVQTGGLPRSVLADLAASSFPALESLDLWLGTDNYGWDGTIADLQPLIDGSRFPQLQSLALRNSEIQDDIVAAVVSAPIIDRLEELDFSMGNLSDVGAAALLARPNLRLLRKLDLHHHFMSLEMEKRIQETFPNADTSKRQEADEDGDETYRHIAVSE